MKIKVIKCQDLFPAAIAYDLIKSGDELDIDGELYYTLEQVQMYGYGYSKEWVKELDV